MHVKLPDGESFKVYRTGTGGYIPSVTQVLDSFSPLYLRKWREEVGKQEADRRLEQGKVFGSRVHTVAENVAVYGCKPHLCGCGGLKNLDDDMVPYHQAVTRFLDTCVEEVLGIEMELVSAILGVGGKLDLHVRMRDGSLAVIDYKTSKSVSKMHSLQLAAYNLMLLLEDKVATRRLVVHLRKDEPGRYELKEFDEHEREAEVFLKLLDFWHWHNGSRLEQATIRTS